MNGNFAADLQAVFASHGQRPALRMADGEIWTYTHLAERTARLATVLAQVGVAPGDRVLAQVGKTPEAVALYLATLQAGGVYVPLNAAYTAAEVAYFLADAQPRLFVRDPASADVAGGHGGWAVLTLGAGGGSLVQAMNAAKPCHDVAECNGDDLAALVYTSGTTGRSKGAMLTHDNIRSNAVALRRCWGWRDDDVLLHALPLFHVHGLFIALHCALLGGTPTIFLPRFDVDAVKRHLPESTVMMGVPTFYTRLLEDADFGRRHCGGVRVFISGSAPLTPATFDAWQARTGHRILERYGMSETIINTSNPLHGERVAGSVGFALPGVSVRVAGETGEPLPPGEVGGIEVRGENVFKGYWRQPDKTAEEFRPDGHFITGDLGVLDAEGRLSIVGRARDLIISGGYNVYPKEVESVIDELDAVAESAVIGLHHPDFGEGVVAVIVPSGDSVSAAQVSAFLEGRLARFKQPKQVVNVEALPRNSMGKVQKNRLREEFSGLFPSTSRAI
ncbi:MAG: AMP-binding protein [Gammaproteobacteria bacterium]|nr:AMP-binding protein [Gammaproteobacteria bacterium]